MEQAARPLHVGIITSSFPFGNNEEFLDAELESMAKQGCSLTLFPAVPQSKKNLHRDLAVDVVRFSLLSPHTFYRAFFGLRRNARAVFGILMTILRSRNRFKTKLKNLALLPTGLAVADEVCVRDLSHIHAYWLSGVSTVALIASQVAGVSWSYTAHSGDIFLEDNLIAEKTESARFGRVISELGRRGILRQLRGVSAERLEVIHLGVLVPSRTAMPKTAPSNGIRLLCPAYFLPVKDHISVLVGLREVVDAGLDCHCVFAGEGPLRASAARKIKELGLESVVSMPGVIPHLELLQQLQSGMFDAVVLASVGLEGIPVSLIEAMAAGLPCIATRTGAIAELIDPACGILVNERDPHALGQAIMTLALDPARRKELGERARQRVAGAFDAVATSRSLLRLMVQA